MSPAALDLVLGKLARQTDANVLVGFDNADDAGVYKISDQLALVQTVDFFTPVVDAPYTFGQIAATNALSDVYAMGGRPISALALVCFPANGDLDVLERIMAGGLEKMMEAGCAVIGGHSIRDEEIKFGYAVTGVVSPERIFSNDRARAGDRLLLSKALGTGVISTAIKKQKAETAWIEAATEAMTTLNRTAAEICTAEVAVAEAGQPEMLRRLYAVHTMTDVTGFGLIGHARELARASNVSLKIEAGRVPLLPGALECVREGHIPGGLNNNREFAECVVEYGESVPEELRTMLFDPQTAGGLLISVDAGDAQKLAAALNKAGVAAVEIGAVLPSTRPLIRVE